MTARFVHTNLVARSYPALARFYETVFGCTPVPPERNLSGESIEQATSLPDARIRGMHLRLPGHGPDGPTLEIFEYTPSLPAPGTAIHRPGFGHIAFAVDDVHEARRAVLEAGGGELGKVVELEVPGAGKLTFAYLTDPEGNIVEVQKWS
jgi:catechol 2,3-dioxygenase-like lactoylglutathione lyase family enzyme